MAYRLGHGEQKVVVVGMGQPFLQQLLLDWRTNPEKVPASITLWLLPNLNPDGLVAGNAINQAGVNLLGNADSRFDNCAESRSVFEPGGVSGAFPFSEPESQILHHFVQDAWLVVFYRTSETEQPLVTMDTCRQFAPTAQLAQTLADANGYIIQPTNDQTGNWLDYLAAQGTATVRVDLATEVWERESAGIQAILNDLPHILAAEANTYAVPITWLNQTNSSHWQYSPNSFIHPIALELSSETAYLIDSGRVWAIHLQSPAPPQLFLQAGDYVQDNLVQEPLDLAYNGNALFVLDRVGDVYRYDFANQNWTLDRYHRFSTDASSRYFMSIAADATSQFLVENSYHYILNYASPDSESAWLIADWHNVDLALLGQGRYLLARAPDSQAGKLTLYEQQGEEVVTNKGFAPTVALFRPRQVVATNAGIYLLDRAGYRLLQLHPQTGQLQQIFQLSTRQAITAFAADTTGQKLLLAAQDQLFFVNFAHPSATISTPFSLATDLHDPKQLLNLEGWLIPIEGSEMPANDLQLPGAPRHYRLGVHQGIDFYWQSGTPIRATADGIVVRADWDYIPPYPVHIWGWQTESQELGYTSTEALDGYRGRQVWIRHANGIISRYAHLTAIDPAIVEGNTVLRGQRIGEVGNSGSPASISSQTDDAHLHFELWLNDTYLGQYLRPIETREFLEIIFAPK